MNIKKSSGMRTLPPNTNIWYNADNKNPVWTGGKEEYGKKNNPRVPYHVIPKTYADVISHIKQGLAKDMFEEDRFAILTGHVEDYKTGMEIKKRLKVLGKMGTKMQLEGKLETVLYSEVRTISGNTEFVLTTMNDGLNTARSPMGVFESVIPNDYNLVISKLIEF